MARTIEEWVAKHDDQAIPARVRLRVFEKFKGVCQLSDVKFYPGDKWEIDHIKELWDGGEHRESNLQPVLVKAHRKKSTAGKTAKARADRLRKSHIGVPKPKTAFTRNKYRKKMDGSVVLKEAEGFSDE